MPETNSDGDLVYLTSELTGEELFVLDFLKGIQDSTAWGVLYRKGDKSKNPAKCDSLLAFYARFRERFHRDFLTAPISVWASFYAKGVDALKDRGLIADVIRDDKHPGSTGLWMPRTIHWERIREGVFVLSEG